jgi:small subunit ribosomal protein S19e
MTTVYDVPPDMLIAKVTEKLRANDKITTPAWAPFAKTGVHREKAPYERDWWHTRVAAVLRKVYTMGPIGVSKLRSEYGGTRDRGAAPNRARSGSGSIIRESLQQLEAAGLVTTQKGDGRAVSAAGRKLCDASAHEVAQVLVEKIPALAKY